MVVADVLVSVVTTRVVVDMSAGRLVTVALVESTEPFDVAEDEDDDDTRDFDATPLIIPRGTSSSDPTNISGKSEVDVSSIVALLSALLLMDLDLSFVPLLPAVVLSCIAVSSSLDW